MISKVKITNLGGSYYDDDIEDTIHFKVIHNPKGDMEFPNDGYTLWINTWDSCGERETLSGNTHYRHNGLSNVKRDSPIAIRELIKELLNL